MGCRQWLDVRRGREPARFLLGGGWRSHSVAGVASLHGARRGSSTIIGGMPPAPSRHLQLAVLLLVALPFLFVKLGLPLLDPDEGLYASIAQEMLTRGDWVIPHINGLPYLEKPPLYFWLTALTFRVVGPTEWAVRLWSALATLRTVLLTWRIGRRLYGDRAGLLAGLMLATVVGNALYVRKASTDQLFIFYLALGRYRVLRDVQRPQRGRGPFLWLYGCPSLRVPTKGLL